MRLVKKAAMVAKRFLFPEERSAAVDSPIALLQPFRHQVAGHTGIFEVDDQHICKLFNQFEADFYRQMPEVLKDKTPALCFEAQLKPDAFKDEVDLCIVAANPDSRHAHSSDGLRVERTPDPMETSEFRDVFSGLSSDLNPWSIQCQMRTMKRKQSLQRFLIFENLTAGFRKPSILDLKLGTRQYGESASEEKKDRQRRKCAKSTSRTHGMRLCGLQYYDEQMGGFECVDKYNGRSLNEHGLKKFIAHFFRSGGGEIRRADCRFLLDQIEKIKAAVASVSGLRLYGVSLLIIIEGATEWYSEHKPVAKLIDFATSCINPEDSGVDEGCLFGLTQLSLMLHNLIDEASVRE